VFGKSGLFLVPASCGEKDKKAHASTDIEYQQIHEILYTTTLCISILVGGGGGGQKFTPLYAPEKEGGIHQSSSITVRIFTKYFQGERRNRKIFGKYFYRPIQDCS
jgi:hypothetical protein